MRPSQRIAQLRRALHAAGDPDFASFHKGYHKSPLKFYGIKTTPLRALEAEAFPKRPRLAPELVREAVTLLWASEYFEERITALSLLARLVDDLELADLVWLKSIAHQCDGWGVLDSLACRTLSPLAKRLGEPLYQEVFGWRQDDWMWTRRAAILVHIMPSRAKMLAADYPWRTFDALLHEKEFFIRKAIGWTLREISKQYPQAVHDYLMRVGEKAAPLTRREGARNLPDRLRLPILGK